MNMRARRWALLLIILLLAAAASGCSFFSGQETDENDSDIEDPVEEEITLILYFGGPQAEGLVRETRTVLLNADAATLVVQELIRGPESDTLLSTIPQGTRLLSVSTADGTARVDFSEEMIIGHPGGSTGEMLTVYSIVNSLTELPGIVRVQFLIQGEVVDTLAGHIEISEPLERNSLVIEH